MRKFGYVCKPIEVKKKKKKPLKEISFSVPVEFCLPCETPAIIEIYDVKVCLGEKKIKTLGTHVVISGQVQITVFYVTPHDQMHRIVFWQEYSEVIDLRFFVQKTVKLKITGVLKDLCLDDPVSGGVKSLGFKKIKGHLIFRGVLFRGKKEYF